MTAFGGVSPHTTASGSIRRWRLANGLRVLALADHELPLVATCMVYDTGSAEDPEGRCGLAHLVEHLVFRGDSRRTVSHPAMIERRGGESNAVTSHDATRYTQLLPGHQLALALWIETRRMAEPVGPALAEDLELERRVLLQERRQQVDGRPHGRDLEHLHALLFEAGHPYHRPTLGRPDELRAIGEADVRTFLQHHYRPSRAALVLVGDLPADVEQQVERTLGQVSAGDPLPTQDGPTNIRAEPGPGHDRWLHVGESVAQTRSYVAYATGGFGRPEARAAQLAAGALAIGPESPLRRVLERGMGVALGVQAMVSPLRHATSLIFAAGMAPGVDPRRLEESLAEQVAQGLAQLDPEALEAARQRALHDHYFRHQALVPRAEAAACWLLWHDLALDPRQEPERFTGIDSTELVAWGRALADGGDRAVLSVLPEEMAA